jgi:cysteinyl-tRNA synthetase
MIELYNTLTKQKETFTPIEEGQVKMYHCGPTVYSSPHIGNLRPYIFADTLKRLFIYEKYDVTQVINITDVGHLTSDGDTGEDKLEKASKEKSESAQDIAERYTTEFLNALEALNVNMSETIFPRATAHIDEQITIIKKLETNGHTYTTSDGVYFDTSTFKKYGALGGIDLKGLQEGARVEKNSEKRNPTDFALWKFSKPEEKRQQEWQSPWGVGFPGWHIECSAMSMKYLGETFDIHTGGVDHIPVHHNNEIAQSECATGKPFAHYWLHNEFIVGAEGKLSKSKGENTTLKVLHEKGVSPLAYRYWLLTGRYSTQMTCDIEALKGSGQAYINLINDVADLPEGGSLNADWLGRIVGAVEDDLDTPKAIALIWDLLKSEVASADKRATVIEADKLLGLDLQKQITYTQSIPKEITELLEKREEARKKADWSTADLLRTEIETKGFEILDTESGSNVRRKL